MSNYCSSHKMNIQYTGTYMCGSLPPRLVSIPAAAFRYDVQTLLDPCPVQTLH